MANFMTPKKIGSGLNTHNLIRQGWEGKFFDAEFENLDIGLYKRVLTRETIVDIFREVNIPIDVDYVSIDVDSVDAFFQNPANVSLTCGQNSNFYQQLLCEMPANT